MAHNPTFGFKLSNPSYATGVGETLIHHRVPDAFASPEDMKRSRRRIRRKKNG